MLSTLINILAFLAFCILFYIIFAEIPMRVLRKSKKATVYYFVIVMILFSVYATAQLNYILR